MLAAKINLLNKKNGIRMIALLLLVEVLSYSDSNFFLNYLVSILV
jgi:uncharacterized membrane protein YwzB